MVDYSGFRRSQNVEGEPSNEVKALLGQLTAPLQATWHGLTEHPFIPADQYYSELNQQANPVPDPNQYTPLAKAGGIEDVG